MPDNPLSPQLDTVNPSDLAQIAAVAKRIWPIAYQNIITPEQIEYMLGTMYSLTSLQDDVSKSGIHYEWITSGQLRLGFIAYGPVAAGSSCLLHKFYLETDQQGRGIGSHVLKILIEKVATSKATGLELRVNRHNHRAIGFYRKNRFEVTGEHCLDIGNGFLMDDYLMFRSCD